MTTPAVLGPGTPYITPDLLQRQPIGVAWPSLVSRSGGPQELAAILADICQQATGLADGYCQQPLRATLNTEELQGPGRSRVGVDGHTNVATCVMHRSPVLQVTSVQVSLATSFPRVWTTVPAGQYEPARPVIGMYGTSSPADSGEGGQTVLIAPGWVSWRHGRGGYRVAVSYINGWPHTSLTANVMAGATTIAVDDCTGWAPVAVGAPGAVGIVFDGAFQEAVTCVAASAVSGPGTLTLSSALGYNHNARVMVSTMAPQVRWATALFAASQALTRGATTTTIHSTGASSSGSKSPEEFSAEAELMLGNFRRVI